ncbi:Ran-binding protein 10, partial [Glycine soja]
FGTRDDVLVWVRSVAHEKGFVAIIIRSDTYTGRRGRSSFMLIGCERSGQYKCRNKEFVRRDTGTRKCGCPFRLHGKPVLGGEGWMVKLICGMNNHELAKTLVGHLYAGRLTKDEKNIIEDMTKSMVKPRNILLTLKEHNANSCTTIKQIYNARSAYRSSIRGADTEMQHLMKLLERDQYIHWHRLKDEVVVRDLFWCHPDAVKLCNACHLVFFIDSTYKTNRYRLPLLDFVGVTPTAMTFSAGFAYLEAERVNNIVWALERFRGLFLRHDRLPLVIVTDRDLALMNAVKTVWEDLIAGHESSHGVLYSGDEDTGSTFLSGDVIGAGINYSTNEFFFCKNGELVHSVPNNLSNRGLYPTIAVLSQHEEMHVNFGQKPFAFNLKDFEARERRKQQQKIEEISLSPQVTYSLIRSYLLHSGYEDTFNSFDVVPSSPITDEQTNTLNHRSTLRQLIMNGNVDGAFAKVHEWYPQIVEVGSQLCIYLLHYYGCYKFELIFKLAYEMPLEVLANAVNAFVLSTDPHMEEAKDCLHSPLERLLKQLTACKRYEGEDFLVEKEFSKRD